jgi:hypothetical protein
MKKTPTAPETPAEGDSLGDVPVRDLDGEVSKQTSVASRTHQHAHVMAACHQVANNRRADEARSAGHDRHVAHSDLTASPAGMTGRLLSKRSVDSAWF